MNFFDEYIVKSDILRRKGEVGFKMVDPSSIIPIKKIIAFCKKHSIIAKLSLFGSALTGNLRPESDIDFLVEFEVGKTPSLFTLINLEDELSHIVGRKIDLRTPEELSRYFRNEVVAHA